MEYTVRTQTNSHVNIVRLIRLYL